MTANFMWNKLVNKHTRQPFSKIRKFVIQPSLFWKLIQCITSGFFETKKHNSNDITNFEISWPGSFSLNSFRLKLWRYSSERKSIPNPLDTSMKANETFEFSSVVTKADNLTFGSVRLDSNLLHWDLLYYHKATYPCAERIGKVTSHKQSQHWNLHYLM